MSNELKGLDRERKVIEETIFYSSDFVKGREIKRWWVSQFKKASKMNDSDLVKWAQSMLDMEADKDFKKSVYYLRDEIVEQFKRIVKEGKQK